MLQALRQKAWSKIGHAFPLRQIYIRSDGRVQFFTFDPVLQVSCAAAGIVILGWVAFTSVNVLFKDRIIEAKERHFIEMQAAYETRLAELQISYDELNSSLASAESRFELATNAFEAKQQALVNLIEQRKSLSSAIGATSGPAITATQKTAAVQASVSPTYLGMSMGGVLEGLVPNLNRALNRVPTAAASMVPLRAAPPFNAESQTLPLNASTAARSNFFDGAVRRIGEFFGRRTPAAELEIPALHHIAQFESRISELDESMPALVSQTKDDADQEVERLNKILRTAGVNPKGLAGIQISNLGKGGPLLQLEPSQIETSDPSFNSGIVAAVGSLTALNDLVSSLHAVPLTTPVQETNVTSGFGSRTDPFTEELAYHAGIDFAGAKGTDVHVTAPGVVVFAARAGAYGNMVEVDHGNRIHTRYAHLMQINVPVGAKVDKGDVVGELGSTGRSTGPHVHYEVWYDNVARDPQKFIKAGRDVLKNQ